jgi:hypothetical protein
VSCFLLIVEADGSILFRHYCVLFKCLCTSVCIIVRVCIILFIKQNEGPDGHIEY